MTLCLLLLLLAEIERSEGNSSNSETLVPNAWNITGRPAASAETSDHHSIVFIDIVQTAVAWDEGSDLFVILLQENSHTLSQCRVRLLGFEADLADTDATGMGGAAQSIPLELTAGVRLAIVLVGPPTGQGSVLPVDSPLVVQFSCTKNTPWLMCTHSVVT